MRENIYFLVRLVPFIVEIIVNRGSHQFRKMRVSLLSEGARHNRYVFGSVVVKVLLWLTSKVAKELKQRINRNSKNSYRFELKLLRSDDE